MSYSSEFSRLKKAVRAKDWDSLDSFLFDDFLEDLQLTDKQAMACLFFEYGENLLNNLDDPLTIERAYCAFEKALRLDISHEKSWVKFAEAHFRLANAERDIELMNKANEIFSHAQALYRIKGKKLPPETFWLWGKCLYSIAKDSEEMIDLKACLDKLRMAYEEGVDSSAFFLDYGMAFAEVGMLLGKLELLVEASHYLERSLKEEKGNILSWLRLACTYKVLYFMTEDITFFEKSDQSFISAERFYSSESYELDSNNKENCYDFWLNWAQLLIFEGKISHDHELLSAGLEKLIHVEQIKKDDLVILYTMGDALTHLGIFEDKFEYLKEAEINLSKANLLFPNSIDTLLHYGHCLSSIGKYFGDMKYFHEAIEKFRKAISLNKTNPEIWHGLASTNFMIAELTSDRSYYTRALKFFTHVAVLGGDQPSYWNDWGVALMKYGELTNESSLISEAVEKFETAIQVYNSKNAGICDPDWFYNYGCSLDWLGSYDPNPLYFERAISIHSRLLEQYPHMHHIRYNLGLALYHLGDTVGDVELLEKSIEQFHAYMQSEPEDETALTDIGLTYLTLAEILEDTVKSTYAKDCFLKAESYFSQALALGNTRTNYYMACLHALKSDINEAIRFLERAKASAALPSLELLLEDDWMIPILNTPEFKAFLRNL